MQALRNTANNDPVDTAVKTCLTRVSRLLAGVLI